MDVPPPFFNSCTPLGVADTLIPNIQGWSPFAGHLREMTEQFCTLV